MVAYTAKRKATAVTSCGDLGFVLTTTTLTSRKEGQDGLLYDEAPVRIKH